MGAQEQLPEPGTSVDDGPGGVVVYALQAYRLKKPTNFVPLFLDNGAESQQTDATIVISVSNNGLPATEKKSHQNRPNLDSSHM